MDHIEVDSQRQIWDQMSGVGVGEAAEKLELVIPPGTASLGSHGLFSPHRVRPRGEDPCPQLTPWVAKVCVP